MAITATVADAVIQEFWTDMVVGALRKNAGWARRCSKRFDDTEIMTTGDTVDVPVLGSLTARTKTGGVPITLDSPTTTTAQVVLNTVKYAGWIVEDEASAKARAKALDYLNSAVVVLVQAVVADLAALYTAANGTIGSAGTDLTYDSIRLARKAMNDDLAPMEGRMFVVASKDEASLLDDTRMVEAQMRPDSAQAIREGALLRTLGFDIFMSQLITETSGPTAFHNLAFHPDGIALVSRPLPEPEPGSGVISQVISDPETGISLRHLKWYSGESSAMNHKLDLLYGVKVIDARLVTEVTS